ncbi:MAG: biotin/lipoyl-containing protein, partial [Acidimicrobiales bacterium]
MPDITMPQLGETVTEGTITRWLKKVGDQVAHDEPLFEVSTEKVDSEVPSSLEGVLTEILVEEGATVDVGTKLAVIGDASDPPTKAPPAEPSTPAKASPDAEAPAPAPASVAAPAPAPAPAPTPSPAPAPTPSPAPAPSAAAGPNGASAPGLLSPV